MTALTSDRIAPEKAGLLLNDPVAASARIFGGALVALDASGNAIRASANRTLRMRGVAHAGGVDNTAGSAGDARIDVAPGVYRFSNSSSGDAIARADIGNIAWAVDDEQVAKTSNSGARPAAGIIWDVDAQGVWVRIDDALMAAWRQGRRKSVGLRATTIAGAGSPVYRVVSPFTGLVTRIQSVIEAALTTGDATLTCGISGTAITGGVLTVTQSGSAAGDVDSATPTAANYVTAGQVLTVTVTGSQNAAAAANIVFEIDAE